MWVVLLLTRRCTSPMLQHYYSTYKNCSRARFASQLQSACFLPHNVTCYSPAHSSLLHRRMPTSSIKMYLQQCMLRLRSQLRLDKENCVISPMRMTEITMCCQIHRREECVWILTRNEVQCFASVHSCCSRYLHLSMSVGCHMSQWQGECVDTRSPQRQK
jgi:hypothetical protein